MTMSGKYVFSVRPCSVGVVKVYSYYLTTLYFIFYPFYESISDHRAITLQFSFFKETQKAFSPRPWHL